MGCGFLIRTVDGRPRELDYDLDNPVNKGSLCPRGNYMLELLNNPSRLEGARIKLNGSFYSSTFDIALSEIYGHLSEIKRAHGAGAVGIMVGPNFLNEDIAQVFAVAKALGIASVDVMLPLEDSLLLSGESTKLSSPVKKLSVEDIADQEALLVVGDILVRSPVTSKMINKVKYGVRGSKIIVVDPERSHTSWFSTRHLQVKPGTEALLLAGMIKAITEGAKKGRALALKKYFKEIDLKQISERTGISTQNIIISAKEFLSAGKAAVILSSGTRDKRLMEMAKLLCLVSGEGKGVIPFYACGNSLGAYKLRTVLKSPGSLTAAEIIDNAASSKIKALVLIGVDLLRIAPTATVKKALSNLSFIAAMDMYRTSVMDYADVIIPLSSHLEAKGSAVYSGGRVQHFEPVSPPAGSLAVRDAMAKIFMKMANAKARSKKLDPSVLAKKALKKFTPKAGVSVPALINEVKAVRRQKPLSGFPFQVMLKDDIVHSSDGSITARHYWAMRECGIPYIEINEEDCRKLSITEGSRVLLRTPWGEVIVIARVSSRWQKGTVALPHHFQEIREISNIGKDEATGLLCFYPFAGSLERIS